MGRLDNMLDEAASMLKHTAKGRDADLGLRQGLTKKYTVTNKRVASRKKGELITNMMGMQLADMMEMS